MYKSSRYQNHVTVSTLSTEACFYAFVTNAIKDFKGVCNLIMILILILFEEELWTTFLLCRLFWLIPHFSHIPYLDKF